MTTLCTASHLFALVAESVDISPGIVADGSGMFHLSLIMNLKVKTASRGRTLCLFDEIHVSVYPSMSVQLPTAVLLHLRLAIAARHCLAVTHFHHHPS